MTYSGGNSHPVGDRGQRYEVTFLEKGERKVFGWTTTLEGAELMRQCVEDHPVWTDPMVDDRHASNVRAIRG